MKIDKSLILNEIKNHLKFRKDSELARFLGVKPQTLASWHARNSYDLEVLYEKCKDISPDWLMSGKGRMLRYEADDETYNVLREPETPYVTDKKSSEVLFNAQQKTIEILEREVADLRDDKRFLKNVIDKDRSDTEL
jgi:hypothetical protein